MEQKNHPAYPQRSKVNEVNWNVEDPHYNPVEFTHKVVIANDRTAVPNGWADPMHVDSEELAKRVSYATGTAVPLTIVNGRPRNPNGRTGMSGRGLLGKYGPNYAADPLVTRKIGDGPIQMVAIKRVDTGDWAIPGGMVDAGEQVSATLKREFTEEAMNFKGEEFNVAEKLDIVFSGGVPVYIGYVNDPRNTDNAWMETTCVHFHIHDQELASKFNLSAGDDASHAKWINIGGDEYKGLYANHKTMVDVALSKID
jgi:ADP-ribose pyrophosphatase